MNTREKIEQIEQALRSAAARKIATDDSASVTFTDACQFWSIDPARVKPLQLHERFVTLEALFNEQFPHFRQSDMAHLRRTHRRLQRHFAKELSFE
ncbi:MAG TPA: hypothetical protein ENN81_10195 [Phycisphaerales bacterium]|nr:hypothetical protein [Phycisphaerales bacterium]